MSPAPRTEIHEETLVQRLRHLLHPDNYAHYEKMQNYHYWEWKMHRICQESPLRGMRSFLYHSRVVAPDRELSPDRSRPFHEYAADLGLPIDMPEVRDPWSGLDDPSVPQRREFLNPGDCMELYENVKPGWVMHGYGNSLTYSLVHTLTNCLAEYLRGDRNGRVKAYQCPGFYSALKVLEIWSVADFVLGLRPRRSVSDLWRADRPGDTDAERLAPFTRLMEALSSNAGEIRWSTLLDVQSDTQQLLANHRPRFEKFGEELVFGTMLGFLIDELVLRSAVPNGMGHCHAFAFAALSALKSAFPVLRARLTKLCSAPDELERILDRLISASGQYRDASARVVPEQLDESLQGQAVMLADELRRLGFESRKRKDMDDKESDLMFTTSNAIWRWIFFLEQKAVFGSLAPRPTAEYEKFVGDLIWRWLRRPWGIVTVADIERTFRGLIPGDENDPSPRAFGVLVPILKSDIEDHLMRAFHLPSKQQARATVNRLIACRVRLHTIRHGTVRVRREGASDGTLRGRAHTLIDLFLTWVYEVDAAVLDRIEADVNEIPAMLRSGKWMDDLIARKGGDPSQCWPPEVVSMMTDYQREPQRYTAKLFRFEDPEFRMEEWIGIYPPESFTFQYPAPSDK